MNLGVNDEDRQLLRLLSASTHIGRPIFTAPDVPAERVAALRKAFDAMVHDPAFVEQARREKFDIEPTTGEAMQKIVTEMMAVPAAQSERLRKIIE
jgi:tripartite-type tricarboxylate transporter receptor subunit TctC